MEIELRIKPKSSLALVNFPELWRFRDLLWTFVWRDFSVKYKQTVLGPIWFVLQPVLPTIAFTFVFGKIAGMPTEGLPQFLFFLCNQIIWGFFASNFSSTSGCLLGNLHLFSKVYFPRLIAPLANVFSNTIAIGVQLAIFVVAWSYFKWGTPYGASLHITPALLFTPLLFLLAAMQGLAFGFWMAALTAKYRDLQQLSGMLVQLWMYGSAIVYPLSQVPLKYQALVSANPVTFVSEAFRYCVLGVGTFSWGSGIYAVLLTIIVFITGLHIFNRSARSYVDVA